ncbi:hypothetical protein NBRC116601_15120 [Cognatishimia sp. WU-CL00825]|uniref:hypothetical protein n=1 Tax=Cognatishimia sp. WU-CL00825 TaxID=3127658 RepID=UPI003102D876
MRWFCLFLILLLPSEARAGPWLRPVNQGFVSVRGALAWPSGTQLMTQSQSLFAEFGATEKTTVFIKIDKGSNRDISVLVGAKRMLRHAENGWRASYTLGIGQTTQGTDAPATLSAGLSLGRNITAFGTPGWLSLDADIFLYETRLPTGGKLLGTAGITLKNQVKLMLQLSAESQAGQAWFFGIEPSFALPISDQQHLKIGLSKQTYGNGALGASLEIWTTF